MLCERLSPGASCSPELPTVVTPRAGFGEHAIAPQGAAVRADACWGGPAGSTPAGEGAFLPGGRLLPALGLRPGRPLLWMGSLLFSLTAANLPSPGQRSPRAVVATRRLRLGTPGTSVLVGSFLRRGQRPGRKPKEAEAAQSRGCADQLEDLSWGRVCWGRVCWGRGQGRKNRAGRAGEGPVALARTKLQTSACV